MLKGPLIERAAGKFRALIGSDDGTEDVSIPRCRQHGVAPSLLFKWKTQYQEGSLTAVAAVEQVVPPSELASAMKQIKELQRLLGKKTWKMSY